VRARNARLTHSNLSISAIAACCARLFEFGVLAGITFVLVGGFDTAVDIAGLGFFASGPGAVAFPVRGMARVGCFTVSASILFISASALCASAAFLVAVDGREATTGLVTVASDGRGMGGLEIVDGAVVFKVAAGAFFEAALGSSAGLGAIEGRVTAGFTP
jgi:hypothetical protein